MKEALEVIRRWLPLVSACLLVVSASSAAAAAPAGRYSVDATAGIVTDTSTGLVWQRAVSASSYTWTGAESYCAALSLGGWSAGWRLPTIKELQSIADARGYNPAMDTTAFPSAPATYFWSSTIFHLDPSKAWVENFGYGETYTRGTSLTARVRCVR